MYSNTDILAGIKKGTINIEPFDKQFLNPNSYDIHLGNTFYRVEWDQDGPYFVGPYVYLDEEKVEIPVSGTLLAMTKEHIGTFGNVVAELRSRSTTRRLSFITNGDAGLGDVGYKNPYTLEITAFSGLLVEVYQQLEQHIQRRLSSRYITMLDKHKLNGMLGIMKLLGIDTRKKPYMTVGQRISQVVFFETNSPPYETYQGQYNENDWPENMVPRKWRHRIVKP